MEKSLVIILILIISLAGCQNGLEQQIEGDVEAIIDETSKIKEVKISPKKVLAKSGEHINLNVEVTTDEGDILDITPEMEYKALDKNIDIDNNRINIDKKALTGEEFVIEAIYKGERDLDIKLYSTIEVFNSLESTIDENDIVSNPDAYDMVVNKQRNLSSEYIPEDLVDLEVETCLPNPEINQLRKVASEAITEMFKTAKEEEGLNLVGRSGYRSYNTQKSLYNSIVNRNGQDYADKYSAVPGQSEHQTGLALDITSASVNYQLEDVFGEVEEGIWVKENAHRFGFIIRYPKGKEDITGYLYEPWHLRYVGKSLAEKVYKSDTTLEEYFENKLQEDEYNDI